MTSISNERGDTTTDLTNMKKIIRNYHEKLYGSKFNHADEIDEFFERYKVPKPTQKEIP